MLAIAMLAGSLLQPAGSHDATTPRELARAGRVDDAIAALHTTIAENRANPEAHELLCQLHASIEQRDEAVSECQTASDLNPKSSGYALQLARVQGAKADHGGALTGMRMVSRIRGNFERAVALDSQSIDALSDLGEFYASAPGIVGGGTDKARALIARLQPLSPARAHRLAGIIASHQKDDAGAEREFQAELAVAHTAEAYVDLANFYRTRKRWDEAAEHARLAIEHDAVHGLDTIDAASLLIDLKRNLPVAQTGLRGYLNSPQTDTVAAYARAHTLLGNTFQIAGDAARAQKEFAAALALAHDYEPARKALTR